jgi:hypothetical protein
MQDRTTAWCRDLAGTRVHGTTRRGPAGGLRDRSSPRSCHWRLSPSISRPGRRPRSIPITTPSFGGRCIPCPRATSARSSTSAATRA